MIVSLKHVFHFVSKIFTTKILKWYNEYINKYNEKSEVIRLLDTLEFRCASYYNDEARIKFRPPVYRSRYLAIIEILNQLQVLYDITKVVDLGCSEMSFFLHIKSLYNVREYIGVDQDSSVFKSFDCKVKPLLNDYLYRRDNPLNVKLLAGNAAKPDAQLLDANVVVAIELIEHMYALDLDVLPHNVFEVIQPEIAIFSTPNADFNCLFDFGLNKFRHYDHKFEWSQSQFQDWCENIVKRFPAYEFWISGIGKGPGGSEILGCCTQIAVFLRHKPKNKKILEDIDTNYEMAYNGDFPYLKPEDRIYSSLKEQAQNFYDATRRGIINKDFVSGDKIIIPLSFVETEIKHDICCSEGVWRKILELELGDGEYIDDNNGVLILDNYGDSSSDYNNSDEFEPELTMNDLDDELYENLYTRSEQAELQQHPDIDIPIEGIEELWGE